MTNTTLVLPSEEPSYSRPRRAPTSVSRRVTSSRGAPSSSGAAEPPRRAARVSTASSSVTSDVSYASAGDNGSNDNSNNAVSEAVTALQAELRSLSRAAGTTVAETS